MAPTVAQIDHPAPSFKRKAGGEPPAEESHASPVGLGGAHEKRGHCLVHVTGVVLPPWVHCPVSVLPARSPENSPCTAAIFSTSFFPVPVASVTGMLVAFCSGTSIDAAKELFGPTVKRSRASYGPIFPFQTP